MAQHSKQADAYQQTGTYSGAMFAGPHALITQMFDGVLTRIAQARGAIERDDVATKAETLSKAVLIVGALEGCLNHSEGGELAANLSRLYEYMSIRLAEANVGDDVERLDEVARLLGQIRDAWVQIPTLTGEQSA